MASPPITDDALQQDLAAIDAEVAVRRKIYPPIAWSAWALEERMAALARFDVRHSCNKEKQP